MKKIIAFALLALLIAVPCAADTWTVNFTAVSGDAEYAVFYYGERDPAVQSAQEFIARTDLTATEQFPLTAPAEIVIDYPEGTQYSIFGKVFTAGGDSDYFMDDKGAYLSPTVWVKGNGADKPVGEAEDTVVDSDGSDVSTDVTVTVKKTYIIK